MLENATSVIETKGVIVMLILDINYIHLHGSMICRHNGMLIALTILEIKRETYKVMRSFLQCMLF